MWRPSKFTLVIRKVRKPFLHCWSCVYLHGQHGHHISPVVWEKQGVTSITYQDSLKLLFNFKLTLQFSFQSEILLLRYQQCGQCHSSLYISEPWMFFFKTLFRSEKHFRGRIAMSALCENSEAPTILGQKWDSLLWVKKISWCGWTRRAAGNQGKKCFMALFNIH